MNPLQGAPNRLQKFMVSENPNGSFEERVPFGTPNWALYGSLPARAATHVFARPVLDAMQYVSDVRTGNVNPLADIRPALGMAGLVAGGGMLPTGPKGALKTGLAVEPRAKVSNLEPFGQQEFMTPQGEWADIFTNPINIAAAAHHHAGGNLSKAAELLQKQIEKLQGFMEDTSAYQTALDALHAHNLPELWPLSKEHVQYINSIPEDSPINPYKALVDLKTGKTNKLPQHVSTQSKDWTMVEGDWEVPSDLPVVAPAVARRTISSAIEPYNWELSSNAAPELRSWNMYTNPALLDDPRYIRAQDLGFNLAHPLVKGVDPSKWVIPEVAWESSAANPNIRGLPDLFGEGFTHPGIGRGKQSENALFAADTPIVSNEYTSHYGGGRGAQNFLGYARANRAGQVYWPEINLGRSNYNNITMDNLIQEMLGQNYDLLAIHGINDLGGTHTQYAVAAPEQFRGIGAQFNPLQADYPNLLLTQGNPFALNFMEPKDERTANKTAGKRGSRPQTGR